VEQLIRLLLTLPCSKASAERSFLTMRRLKTCLRNSASQQRLSHVAVLDVHSERLDKLDLSVRQMTSYQKMSQGEMYSVG
jgi:hAT family C-terminal dimerisation region